MNKIFWGLMIGVMASSGASFSQSAPVFDVASVKPSPPIQYGPGRSTFVGGPRTDAGRATWTNVPLRYFTMQAYGLTSALRIEGGPNWFVSDNFDIVATFPTDTPKENIPLMLKSLLADRFKLTAHSEAREQPVYGLVVAKGGSKLKAYDPANLGTGNRSGKGHLELHNITMTQLGNFLYSEVGRFVVDMSGLSGTYDVMLDWTPADTQADDPKANGPSIFTALQEQLGLRLEAQKASVEFLVIDHAEKPSEN